MCPHRAEGTALRKHLTYANVMATIAVFIALGGSSYAAVKLSRNSVGATQIRKGAVGASELRRGAVRSSDVRNGGLSVRDLSAAARADLRGAQGPTGVPGPEGAAGPATPQYFASFGAGGGKISGNASGATHNANTGNLYIVNFERSPEGCSIFATVTNAAPEGAQDNGGGYATVGRQNPRIVVRTYSANGTPTDLPFSVGMAC